MPRAGCTALQGSATSRAQAAQRLLVNRASGGVGTFAVQIGKPSVTPVRSTRDPELVRSLRADTRRRLHERARPRSWPALRRRPDLVGNRRLGERTAARARRARTLVLAGGSVFDRGGLVGPMGLITGGGPGGKVVCQRIAPCTATTATERLPARREVPNAIRPRETEHARAEVVVTVPERRPARRGLSAHGCGWTQPCLCVCTVSPSDCS